MVKSTCLWLKGLPQLTPTDVVSGRSGKLYHGGSTASGRAKHRSRTFTGIAEAMADQWGKT
jgi:hypothetical protein